ncbi:uncharacterized protein M6B38_135810 [Iris pallida]|uniref:Uncharacterized protein n=1 Tax=Iris pallida TaxID=29817 RepID=A0AAX6F5Y0_IRIPA|nr:uncharacterized protein M6B38_153460 [Iris pallida]KAJ6815216.1 uncharacterized protein M6B38_135810 [Iris pallida]
MGGHQLLLVALLATAITSSWAVEFQATNSATGTPGGDRFDKEIGLDYSKQVMASASSFIWEIFAQAEPDRKNIALVTLAIESMDGVAYTSSNGIHVSANYIAQYSGDVVAEFTGVMYHEMTHVWQWNGNGATPSGLIEGIADYVRLKAGYVPSHWVKPGEGSRWDQGYDVTARFLDYCGGRRDGFVGMLNGRMKDGYSVELFQELLGESVDQLWSDYKSQYN